MVAPKHRWFAHDDEGATPIVGFMVAILVFSVTFYYVTDTSLRRQTETAAADSANYQALAASLAETLIASGAGWYNGNACTGAGFATKTDPDKFQPDSVALAGGQFGLGEEPCLRYALSPMLSTNLSYSKFTNLYGALDEADPANGRVDYAEAKSSLNLPNQDFHIRSWPILDSVRQILSTGQKDPHMRVLYIADYKQTDVPVSTDVPSESGSVDQGDKVQVWLNLTNNGTTATIFAALFSVPLQNNQMEFSLHTKLLQPGEYHNLSFTLRKSADWDWKDDDEKWVDYTVADTENTLETGRIGLENYSMTYATSRAQLFVEAQKPYFNSSNVLDPVKVTYYSYDGDGKVDKYSDWAIKVIDEDGNTVFVTLLPNNVNSGSLLTPVPAAGTYTATLFNDLLTTSWNWDTINSLPDQVAGYTTGTVSDYEPNPAVATEMAYVDALVQYFDANVFSDDYASLEVPALAGGDVYPDVKQVMNNDLVTALTDSAGAASLSKYTTVIVGSNVDHNAMTSAAAKESIKDWVFAGGTLLVFGSDRQNVNWLQPLFHASLDTANGGVLTPDASHPSLSVPNPLDYEAFQYTTEWGYTAGADASFTHIVTSGETGDLLAVGNPGSFGDGRVTLSSWRPYNLTEDQTAKCSAPLPPDSQCQAIFLIHNLLTLTYRYLYLDYGPLIPTDAPTGVTTRVVSVYHPELRSLVRVQLQVYVFPTGA